MPKVLLVVDHPDIRHVLRVQLERMGFAVMLAENGKEKVETPLAEKPDLVLMNSIMPEIDGWEATRVLRTNHETKNIPILAITALSAPSDLKVWIDAGRRSALRFVAHLGDIHQPLHAGFA